MHYSINSGWIVNPKKCGSLYFLDGGISTSQDSHGKKRVSLDGGNSISQDLYEQEHYDRTEVRKKNKGRPEHIQRGYSLACGWGASFF